MEPPAPSFARRNRPWIALAGAVLVVAVLVVVLNGGVRPPATKTTQPRPADEPWQKFLASLRKDVDVEGLRRTLGELNNDLGRAPNAQQPGETPPAELAEVAKQLQLNEAEAREIKPSGYSPLDAAYLEECLYLRDVASSLGVADQPPAKRAAAAFAWVARQVALTPPTPNAPPPFPPSYVLRRGSGTALERGFVFVELCRQLGVDAYLIGKAEGPFWAVGARADKRVLLLDPQAGEPLPFDLEQLRAAAPEFAEKFDALAKAHNVEPAALRESQVNLAVPLPAFAARLRLVEEKLEGDRGVKLSVDRERLVKAAESVAKGAAVAFWNPPADRFTLTRGLANVLSEAEGGFAPVAGNGQSALGNGYLVGLLPRDRTFSLPPFLVNFKEPRDRVVGLAVDRYYLSFLKAPTPRERFQRGQFPEATKALVKEWDEYGKMGERAANEADRQAAINGWAERARRVFTDLNAAGGPNEEARARAAVNQFWKAEARTTDLLVEQIVAPAGKAEAVYLLALCKTEQAERAGGPAAADAWAVAADWWKRYEPFAEAQDKAFPGRKAHADALAARAGKMGR